MFDFLVDIIPRDELKEGGLGVTNTKGGRLSAILLQQQGMMMPSSPVNPEQHHNHHVLVFFLNVIAWLYPRNVDLLCSAGNYWVTLFIHQVT